MDDRWPQNPGRRRLEECLEAVERVLEYRFPHMAGRSLRVAALCQAIGKHLKPGELDDYALALAGRFHDVGMLAVPDGVLFKPGKLTPEEVAAVRAHTGVGGRLVAKFFPDVPAAAEAIFYHHERPDGGGIHAMRGDMIPPIAGVIAVAESVEAMANARPHRPALPAERILEELRQGRDKQFVAEVVDAFLANSAELLGLAVARGAPAPETAPAVSHPKESATSAATAGVKETERRAAAASRIPPTKAPAAPSATVAVAEAPAVAPRTTHAAPALETAVAQPVTPLTREQSFKRLEQAFATRSPSPVVSRVVALTGSPGSEVTDLAGVIATDPVLAARVLDVANSAAYRANRRLTTTVAEAVRNVGISTVRNIALALGMFDQVPTVGDGQFSLIRYWQHSLAVAKLCEELAAAAEPSSAGTGYLAGLCHELGTILFRSHFEAEYQWALAEQERTGKALPELERDVLGTTRQELEAAVFQMLRLPDAVHAAIQAVSNGRTPVTRDPVIPRALACADFMATGLLLATGPDAAVRPIPRRLIPKGPAEPKPPEQALFASGIRSLTATLARLSPEEYTELTEPLFSRVETRVWLTRSADYSAYDPIETALGELADVTAKERLPSADEVKGIGKLVVLAGRAVEGALSPASVAEVARRTAVPTLCLVERGTSGAPVKAAPLMEVEVCPVPLERLWRFLRGDN
jgi:HD-GYP domain-containing protein (c-di-GMP phosphodiesterase class II)